MSPIFKKVLFFLAVLADNIENIIKLTFTIIKVLN